MTSKILKEWSALARVLGRGFEKRTLSTAVKSAAKHINRYGVIDLEI